MGAVVTNILPSLSHAVTAPEVAGPITIVPSGTEPSSSMQPIAHMQYGVTIATRMTTSDGTPPIGLLFPVSDEGLARQTLFCMRLLVMCDMQLFRAFIFLVVCAALTSRASPTIMASCVDNPRNHEACCQQSFNRLLCRSSISS